MEREQAKALLQKKIVVSCVDSQSDASTSLGRLPAGRVEKTAASTFWWNKTPRPMSGCSSS
jgi:hypothetical protein